MQFKDKFVDLSEPKVMGILNVTPDSFSDGGAYRQLDAALVQVQRMVDGGASFIDIGGESTRPGAQAVSTQQELDRVIPVIDAIKQRFDVVISVDTSKALVMQEAVIAGAGLINDVCALQEDGALSAASAAQVPVCLMHMQGKPRTMQTAPEYQDVVAEVYQFLLQRIAVCIQAGIKQQNIIIDPGFGFGKSLIHNYQLLASLERFLALDVVILAGMSRKSMIGLLLNRSVDERLAGSISAAMLAAQQGAKIIRVHDVQETVDALKVLTMMNAYKDNKK
ncbi:dihydropteroate synthase [Paraglaciecola hydrolytica]|uniref:Dihydropteroate synthase n=1 Tax=Paraglaciecola hydrolytica TaxID=1799789 RepID=A0A136A5U4_9ALTE|nr:dihydropteroate synthase [Paraglaciecola hydrolytica]KXI30599.1 dihydropteroate synthase [Paraglaciecola hydrolytica]